MNANSPRVLPPLSGTVVVVATVLMAAVFGFTAFHWLVDRVYVEPGHSLLLESAPAFERLVAFLRAR